MKNIDKDSIKIKINSLIFSQSHKRYILRCSLNDLNLSDNEMEYAISYINKLNIKIVDYEITKKDRTRSVDEYDYGDVSGYGINHLDMPVYAKLEYNDNGDLIYEDYSELDEYIEKILIPNYIRKDTKDNSYYIKLRDLVLFQLNEQEIKYIMEYLNFNGISVHGWSETFGDEFENYVNRRNYNNTYNNYKFDGDEVLDKLIEYRRKPTLELRNEIFLLNYGLIKYCAVKFYKNVNISIYDIESFGCFGLIDAIESFDVSLSHNFFEYAIKCIKRKIVSGIASFLGLGKGNFYRKYYVAKKVIERDNYKKLDENTYLVNDIIELLAKKNMIGRDYINLHKSKVFLSNSENLDEYMDSLDDSYDSVNSNSVCNSDYIIQDNLLELETMNNEITLIFKEYFEHLKDIELKVITMRYGFYNNIEMNFADIGRILGLSRERIRQIHNNGLEKLKKLVRKDRLKTYIEEYDRYNYNPNTIVAYQNIKKNNYI